MLIAVPQVRAQVDSVVVRSNWQQARVFGAGIFVGNADGRVLVVPESVAVLTVTAPEMHNWQIEPLTLIRVPGNGLDTLTAEFPYHYRVESTPFGAEVTYHAGGASSVIGLTPFTFITDRPLTGELSVHKEGFRQVAIHPDGEIWNYSVVALEPDPASGVTTGSTAVRLESTHRGWIEYSALAAGLAAGILAVHWKVQGDRLYDRYRESSDVSLRPRIRSFDHRASVALVGMQIGIGVFAIRLAFR